MATGRRGTRLYPRLVLSVLLSAGLVAGTALPGYSQPSNDQVPDSGARPAPAGQVPLPDGSFARPPTAGESLVGPLAAEIAELQLRIDNRTTELRAIQPQLGPAEQELTLAEETWRTASQARLDAQSALDELVDESYRGAAALPPELFIPGLRELTAHAPVPVEVPLGVAAAARELVQAQAAEQTAASQFDTAQVTEQDLAERHRLLEAELADLAGQLAVLRDRNAELLAEAERARERAAQQLDFPVTQPVAGFRAGAAAVAAVTYALDQLGKPYLWGAEGPDRFDCSGLVFAAYNHARARFGVATVPRLARVAADQYQSTQTRVVARDAALARRGLLPGDLVFFSSGSSWQSIHHVGMYVGDGFMVHAPNRNEVVKVSPVWWTRFFAATRVVEAVQVSTPTQPPTRVPTPEPGPSPTPSRPITPDPTTPGPGGTTTTPPTTTQPSSAPPTSPSPETVVVPDVVGLDPEDAAIAIEAVCLEDVCLEWDVGDPLVSSACTPGVVGAQVPEADTVVPVAGTVVTYRICETPEPSPSPSPEESPSPSPEESPSSTTSPSPTPS
jgi:cell wall-associated NlpC family hydrolase